MNYYLISIISGKKSFHLPESKILKFLPIESYLVIGSTITFYSLDHMTIWGAGIINHNEIDKIRGKPKKICAVRGPLTRKVLMEKKYDCPEVYGDPILLLPKFYQPLNTEKKYEFGIIPHFTDKENSVFQNIKRPDIKIIDIQNYQKWYDFVDEVCSCTYILSSSLHGLIVAEAYNIPSVWVGFSKYADGWEFKFQDFYQSIHMDNITMVPVSDESDLFSEDIRNRLEAWQKGTIDLDLLLSSCPFY